MNQTWLRITDTNDNAPAPGSSGKDGKRAVRGRPRSSSKRTEILRIAQEQFLLNGYDGTSIDSIVEIIGGSKSTIYSHFGNKESLFAAVIQHSGHNSETPDFPLENGNVRDELIAFAQTRLRRVLSPLNIGIMRIVIAEAPRLSRIAALFYHNAPEPTYIALKTYLEDAVTRKVLAIDDIEEATDLFLGGLLQRDLLANLFDVKGSLSASEMLSKSEKITDRFLLQYSPETNSGAVS